MVITLCFFSLLSCNKTSDVDALNQRIDELGDIIEQHKERAIKDYLTRDFSVAQRFNKKQFILFIHYHLKRNKSISISVMDKEITHYDNYAEVTAKVLLLGSNEWLPERGQMYSVASRWKKEDGDWKVSHLRWEKMKYN